MVTYEVEKVELAWVDNGHKMWCVFLTRTDDDSQWTLHTWARDEIDARNKILTRLEEEQIDDDQD